ncbi:hypothetical protein [Pseudohoeflea coraliihabitans]|uniref:Uncharacterized protein n=1 Tax=Pseudohoeflea coraliihabitans TaxID=2860393 RepID=A0ABS6WJA8_9HYPH|nr:hypothetical protein [Pseudohoeflea sp. DP4N28-3]MBW3096028.1 hypothetical protein [Pseudohoeflea sp. DP4N28-3]
MKIAVEAACGNALQTAQAGAVREWLRRDELPGNCSTCSMPSARARPTVEAFRVEFDASAACGWTGDNTAGWQK